MNSKSNAGFTGVAANWPLAITAFVALAAGASAAGAATTMARAASEQRSAPNARPGDTEQRNRQFQKAEALYLSGHLKEAAAAFAELSRNYPNDARIWLKYGNTLTKLANYDEAATAYQTAVTVDPEQGNAALNLSLVRLLQAEGSLDIALSRLAPDSAEHAQADTLQRQIKTLLGGSEHGAAPH